MINIYFFFCHFSLGCISEKMSRMRTCSLFLSWDSRYILYNDTATYCKYVFLNLNLPSEPHKIIIIEPCLTVVSVKDKNDLPSFRLVIYISDVFPLFFLLIYSDVSRLDINVSCYTRSKTFHQSDSLITYLATRITIHHLRYLSYIYEQSPGQFLWLSFFVHLSNVELYLLFIYDVDPITFSHEVSSSRDGSRRGTDITIWYS